MRDMLSADKQALVQSLASAQAAPPDPLLRMIPTTAQMVLGFSCPSRWLSWPSRSSPSSTRCAPSAERSW